MPELITLSDRIAVLNNGRLAGILPCEQINETNVMRLAATEMEEGGVHDEA